MKKLLIILTAVILISCRQMDVISDPYWTALVPRLTSPSLKSVLKSFTHIYRINYVTVGAQNGMDELGDILRSDHAEIVLLSPLLSLKIEDLKKKFPTVRFYYYRFSGEKKRKLQKDTDIAINGYGSITFSRMLKIADKLIYFIMEKENKKDYKDINLENLE